jgi:hypothetical protein
MKLASRRARYWAARWPAGLVAVTATVLVLSSVAYACTAIMGPIKVCSVNNGSCSFKNWPMPDGSTKLLSAGHDNWGAQVKVSAIGLQASPATYGLHASNPGGLCHNNYVLMKDPKGRTLTKMKTDSTGSLDKSPRKLGAQPYIAVLPKPALLPGSYPTEICAEETLPTPRRTASNHSVFTIIVM